MSIDRRNFFKILGVTAITVAGIHELEAATTETGEIEFKGLLFDSTRCIGCRGCERACAEAHNLPAPPEKLEPGVIRKTSEIQRSVINTYQTSKGEAHIRNQCMHCNEPACAAACLTKAMYKTKEGPVIWRGEKCMGCRYCMVSCPFDVPKFEYHSANPKIQKCDMCYDRIVKGEIPVCAETCGDALIFGTRRELIAEARKRIVAEPEKYVDVIYGEHVAGGTGYIYLSSVPFNELGFNTGLQNASYPALTKGFLYSVPAVFVLLPTLLLGIHEATKSNLKKDEDND
jgi:formate dehydrogenase iron-sulfur subunit